MQNPHSEKFHGKVLWNIFKSFNAVKFSQDMCLFVCAQILMAFLFQRGVQRKLTHRHHHHCETRLLQRRTKRPQNSQRRNSIFGHHLAANIRTENATMSYETSTQTSLNTSPALWVRMSVAARKEKSPKMWESGKCFFFFICRRRRRVLPRVPQKKKNQLKMIARNPV